jgi:hypothetical protein
MSLKQLREKARKLDAWSAFVEDFGVQGQSWEPRAVAAMQGGRGSNINSGGLEGKGQEGRGRGRIRHRNVRNNHIGNISHNRRISDWGSGGSQEI